MPGALRFVRMAGSSIASPSAAPFVIDFLNAAYYAHRNEQRAVDDLRLAHGIITTYWAGLGGRRLDVRDVVALNRVYGRLRLHAHGRLDRPALLDGAARLIGPWFAEAWADGSRRADGVAFPSCEARRAFAPECRLAHAALGPLTPPRMPPPAQHWSTYDPVELPDVDAALELLCEPARWPDMGCATGRFTALRATGLLGQTFEIEVVAEPTPRSPVFTRGYVTCTTFATQDDDPALAAAVADLVDGYLAATGATPDTILPDGATPLALIILTTHEGHFLGPARSHLLVWRDTTGAWVRDIGVWDRLAVYLDVPYRLSGRRAQHAFWGPAPTSRSMLGQLAAVSAEVGARHGTAQVKI
jgi:hypothetical protein